MSRILKRPMFRIGGSANNEGIMSSVVPTRAGYAEPQGAANSLDNYQIDTGSSLYKKAIQNAAILNALAGTGRSQSDRLSDLLIRGGLRTMSETPRGGLFPTLAKAFQEPVEQYLKSGETEDLFQRQLRLTGATQAMTSEEALELAKLKYGMEAGKEQEQRKKELMQQYGLDYTEANIFQNFLNQRDAIGKTVGLPVSNRPIFLALKKGKYEVTGIKGMPEGIYYDPKTNKYVKIKSGTSIIGNSIQDVIKPENQVISQQSYRDYINEELAKKQRQKIEAEGYTSFDSSSP